MSASSSSELLQALGGLLQQLEAAQGGADPEARSKMDALRQQLSALDLARQRAAAAEAGQDTDSGGGAGGLQDGAASRAAASASGDAQAMLQHMDGLSARLSGLESKLAQLDAGSRAVLLEAGGDWLGTLQAGEDDSSDTAAQEAEVEEAAGVAEAPVAAAGVVAAAPQPE
ncbi:hypothetical protein ABPG75_008882 [Micractinium tetrahymenae]